MVAAVELVVALTETRVARSTLLVSARLTAAQPFCLLLPAPTRLLDHSSASITRPKMADSLATMVAA